MPPRCNLLLAEKLPSKSLPFSISSFISSSRYHGPGGSIIQCESGISLGDFIHSIESLRLVSSSDQNIPLCPLFNPILDTAEFISLSLGTRCNEVPPIAGIKTAQRSQKSLSSEPPQPLQELILIPPNPPTFHQISRI